MVWHSKCCESHTGCLPIVDDVGVDRKVSIDKAHLVFKLLLHTVEEVVDVASVLRKQPYKTCQAKRQIGTYAKQYIALIWLWNQNGLTTGWAQTRLRPAQKQTPAENKRSIAVAPSEMDIEKQNWVWHHCSECVRLSQAASCEGSAPHDAFFA